jgi:hypothetical protein
MSDSIVLWLREQLARERETLTEHRNRLTMMREAIEARTRLACAATERIAFLSGCLAMQEGSAPCQNSAAIA